MTTGNTIFINGKFLAQSMTGVQRFATEITLALDRISVLNPNGPKFVLLVPASARQLKLTAIECRHVHAPLFSSLHLWEHVALPLAARSGFLLSLAGTAPFLHPRQIASLLDTAIYDHPSAYTKAFVAVYRLLFSYLARHALLIVTLTEFTRERLQDRLSPRAHVVPIFAAADQFRSLSANKATLTQLHLQPGSYYLAVGSTNPTKNFSRLIDAFRMTIANGSSRRLVIAGGYNSSVFKGSAEMFDDDRIIHVGVISDDSLKSLYQNAYAFVFPSIYEGFGLPPLEAMICGCPVIAARSASIPEICADAALYFDPFDVMSMSEVITRMDGDNALRTRLLAAGRTRGENFSWDKSAATLFRAIGNVVTPKISADDGKTG